MRLATARPGNLGGLGVRLEFGGREYPWLGTEHGGWPSVGRARDINKDKPRRKSRTGVAKAERIRENLGKRAKRDCRCSFWETKPPGRR